MSIEFLKKQNWPFIKVQCFSPYKQYMCIAYFHEYMHIFSHIYIFFSKIMLEKVIIHFNLAHLNKLFGNMLLF